MLTTAGVPTVSEETGVPTVSEETGVPTVREETSQDRAGMVNTTLMVYECVCVCTYVGFPAIVVWRYERFHSRPDRLLL